MQTFGIVMLALLTATYTAAATTAPVPTVKTEATEDLPLTAITIPWTEPSAHLPGTDANPTEKVVVYLRGSPINDGDVPYLTNAQKDLFVVNLKWATHTSLVYVILRDTRGYMHIMSLNKQVLGLFPKSFSFPDPANMRVSRVRDNRLQVSSYAENGHSWCDFQLSVQPSGDLRLLHYAAHHDRYYQRTP